MRILKLGEKLRILREAHGWTQEDVAHVLGLKAQSRISTFESDKTPPSALQLLVLAALFGVSADYLLHDEESEPRPYVPPSSVPRAPDDTRYAEPGDG